MGHKAAHTPEEEALWQDFFQITSDRLPEAAVVWKQVPVFKTTPHKMCHGTTKKLAISLKKHLHSAVGTPHAPAVRPGITVTKGTPVQAKMEKEPMQERSSAEMKCTSHPL